MVYSLGAGESGEVLGVEPLQALVWRIGGGGEGGERRRRLGARDGGEMLWS